MALRTQRPSSRLRTAGVTPYTRRVRTVLLSGAFLATPFLVSARATLEVFTTHTRPVALDNLPNAAALAVTVYTLDDIERVHPVIDESRCNARHRASPSQTPTLTT